jgi:phosphate transport system ATP-binding protein
MIQTPESEKAMSSTQPSSLASVANARIERTQASTATGTGLESRGVHAWFGKNHVLADINLEFAAGSVTALIGPSGCGKSTFIRTMNRMHEFIPGAAMAGQVLLDGKDVYAPGVDVTKIRLQIGMVFQKPNPFPSMTIGENVLSGLKLAQIKVADKDELLESCLVRAGLWNEVKDRLDAHGGSLSGGQQQRLCIARALAVSPQVLLMDEPCSALDPGSTY